jgi:hypothetical protein
VIDHTLEAYSSRGFFFFFFFFLGGGMPSPCLGCQGSSLTIVRIHVCNLYSLV